MLGIAAVAVVVGAISAALLLGTAGDEEAPPERFAEVELDDEDFEDAPGRPATDNLPAPQAQAPTDEAIPSADLPAEDPELEPCPDAWRDPIRLFGDAQVRPVYEHRTMLGVSIRGVKPDSFWEELGIDSEDRIVELDGDPIDSPQMSVDLMNVLEGSDRIRLRLRTSEGRDQWVSWDAPEPPDPATLPEHCR